MSVIGLTMNSWEIKQTDWLLWLAKEYAAAAAEEEEEEEEDDDDDDDEEDVFDFESSTYW